MNDMTQITADQVSDGQIGPVPIPPSAKMMDWRFESHDAATMTLTVSFAAKPEFTNPVGIIQGGILTAMMDDVMGPAMVAATGATRFPTSTDIHTTYYAAAQPGGRLMVTARVDRMGKTIAYCSAEIRDDAGTLIAKGIQTARMIGFAPPASDAPSPQAQSTS